MSSRFVLVYFNSLHFVSFDYTVSVLHHHHFFDFALVCERSQQLVVEFWSFRVRLILISF